MLIARAAYFQVIDGIGYIVLADGTKVLLGAISQEHALVRAATLLERKFVQADEYQVITEQITKSELPHEGSIEDLLYEHWVLCTIKLLARHPQSLLPPLL